MQNVEAWIGDNADAWAFVPPRQKQSYGPISKAQLAFLLHQGKLKQRTLVYHVTQTVAVAKKLQICVEDWQDTLRDQLGRDLLVCYAFVPRSYCYERMLDTKF